MIVQAGLQVATSQQLKCYWFTGLFFHFGDTVKKNQCLTMLLDNFLILNIFGNTKNLVSTISLFSQDSSKTRINYWYTFLV